MKKFSTVAVIAAICGSVSLLALSLWPDVLAKIFFFTMLTFPLVATAGLVILVLVVRMAIKTRRAAIAVVFRFALAGLIISASLFAVVFSIPRRIVFPIFQSSFQKFVDSVPLSEYEVTELNRRIGIWRVDRYRADPRGGLYLRTGSGPDGLGPDLMSYGFAYKPNTEGSPFGNAHYHTDRLVEDWYYFQVSDDW